MRREGKGKGKEGRKENGALRKQNPRPPPLVELELI